MLDALLLPFSYGFFVVALIVGASVALVAALVGTHLSSGGFSMLGDGLSHVGFGALAVAAALGLFPLPVAVVCAVLAAFLLLRLASRPHARADALIAMLSAASLAVGVIAVHLSGSTVDLNSYLFGSVLAVRAADAPLLLGLCAVALVAYLVLYPAFFSLSFDEEFLASQTGKASLLRGILAALSAVTVVLGMQSVGALLISALLIFPSASAKHVARTFRMTVALSAVFGVSSFVTGLYLSYCLSLPAGASVVVVEAALYLVCLALGSLLKKRTR